MGDSTEADCGRAGPRPSAPAAWRQEIAAQLVISKKTVDRHRANILDKLELRNRVDLTRYAIRRGLVEP